MYDVTTIPVINKISGQNLILWTSERYTFVSNPYGAIVCGYPEGTIFHFKVNKSIRRSTGGALILMSQSPWILIEMNQPGEILFR